jgi:hypothetical protein
MKSKNVAVPTWEELVAPHAHHYFRVSDHVGVQYPPGTGLTLAAFPEGTALYRLNKTTIVVILLVGLAAIALGRLEESVGLDRTSVTRYLFDVHDSRAHRTVELFD